MNLFIKKYHKKIIISSLGATQKKTLYVLKNLAGKELVNFQTGIKAQLNSEQKGKIISNAALYKSKSNGFSSKQHYAVAAEIEKVWNDAEIVKKKS